MGAEDVAVADTIPLSPVHVTARSVFSAAGAGCDALYRALAEDRSCLCSDRFADVAGAGFIGIAPGIDSVRLPDALARYDCRNHRLAEAAIGCDDFAGRVAAAAARYGPERIAVLMGTSTAGILSTEAAYRARDPDGALPTWFEYRHVHNYGALPAFVRDRLGLAGLTQCVSTACSSSAKVFASASRWLARGLCDAVVVGGVDSLCGTTLYGFQALQVVSPGRCRPFDVDRDGISLGEAAALFLLEREPSQRGRQAVLLGAGESADAHHMSAPHPDGAGAIASMRAALASSGSPPAGIDFVCAHGTATRANDEIEARAIATLLGEGTVTTSTKGTTGHALGAAGALSAIVAVLAIERGLLPGTVNTGSVDPGCPVTVPLKSRASDVRRVLVNAFGFGGNNASLVFGASR